MEGGNNFSNNFTIYLMLIICVILVSVDSIEMYRIVFAWNYAGKAEPAAFNQCFRKELILKTIFGCFSFMAAISAFLLTLFISVSVDFFIDKILPTFLYLNYFIFGPYMLGFAVYGFINWDEVVFQCDRHQYEVKVLSISNMFSLIGCFVMSLVVTLAVAAYEVIMLYIDSILRREGGNKYLRSVFWWAVLRTRGPNFLRLDNNEQNNQQDQQQNIQVNNPNNV
jgi:hypothetical protein